MKYTTRYDKIEDNLDLPRLRVAILNKAINDGFQSSLNEKPNGFTLNDLMPKIAGQIETAEEGFFAGFTVAMNISANLKPVK